jgi:molybdenum cofactor cytidylyltransferase
MGRPKLLLPWGKKTILAHLIEQWTAIGSSQIAVVIEANSPLGVELDSFPAIGRIINPQPELGMWSSVQCAARWEGWNEGINHFVIALGDQPHVGIGTLQGIMNFSEKNAEWICQPARKGRGRHPVVLPRAIFDEIAESTSPRPSPRSGEGEAKTLKEFLRAREAKRKMFDSDDPALDLDIDTPEDYEKALTFFQS